MQTRGAGTNPIGMSAKAEASSKDGSVEASRATLAWEAYRMRWKRRRLLFRAWRKSREIHPSGRRPPSLNGCILAFATVRNEVARLPYWLSHYRRIGVDRFLIVDNGSDDGTFELLEVQPDVSIWRTHHSYRSARFGMDWVNHLMRRFGHGHWCVVADADELLVYPYWEERKLSALGSELAGRRENALGALMIELYPDGALSSARYTPGEDPTKVLPWFDASGYRASRQRPAGNLWVQGGPRDRLFFKHQPSRAPTLNKIPFILWRRSYAWLNSWHSALPPRLNHCWDGPGDSRLSGALLHTKFLELIHAKSREDLYRREHFGDPDQSRSYYEQILSDPKLRQEASERYSGWQQLEKHDLLSRGGWE